MNHPPPMRADLVGLLIIAAALAVVGVGAWGLGKYFVMIAGQFGQ